MMEHYKIFNILDMEEVIGETGIKELLSGFYCPKNKNIRRFVKNNAYEFARKKSSVTYLVIDQDPFQII